MVTKDRYAEKEKDGGKNGNGVKERKNEEKGKVQRERMFKYEWEILKCTTSRLG